MNKFDLAFTVVVALSALMGFIRGITKEILSLVAWVGAVTLAYVIFPLTRHIARAYVSSPMLADAVTLLAIFLIFLIVLTLISHFFTSLIRKSALSGVDRSLGFGYGVVRALVVLFAFELALTCLRSRPEHPDEVKSARFAGFVYKGSDILRSMLPGGAREFIESLREKRISESKPPSLADIRQAGEMAERMAPIARAAAGKKETPTAEELANLKPKAPDDAKPGKKVDSVKQDIAMDRLIAIADND